MKNLKDGDLAKVRFELEQRLLELIEDANYSPGGGVAVSQVLSKLANVETILSARTSRTVNDLLRATEYSRALTKEKDALRTNADRVSDPRPAQPLAEWEKELLYGKPGPNSPAYVPAVGDFVNAIHGVSILPKGTILNSMSRGSLTQYIVDHEANRYVREFPSFASYWNSSGYTIAFIPNHKG